MIPTSPTKFERWMAQECGTWSCELYAKGKFALLTLRSLKGQEKAFAQSKAFRIEEFRVRGFKVVRV